MSSINRFTLLHWIYLQSGTTDYLSRLKPTDTHFMIVHLSTQTTHRGLHHLHILFKLIKFTTLRHLCQLFTNSSHTLINPLQLIEGLFKQVSNILYVIHTTSLALFQRNGKRHPSRTLIPSCPQTTRVLKTIDFSTARASSFLY